MNAVVLHEQLFADHFLMTPAARYSLGQSLRVALITPLIDKFTVTQVEGASLEIWAQCWLKESNMDVFDTVLRRHQN